MESLRSEDVGAVVGSECDERMATDGAAYAEAVANLMEKDKRALIAMRRRNGRVRYLLAQGGQQR